MIVRAFLAAGIGALVVTACMSPLLWIWPAIAAGNWYSFPLLLLWFYGTTHLAAVAVLKAAG